MKEPIEKLASVLHCAACQAEIDNRTVFKGNGRPTTKGDVMVCSACGTINKVGDFDLVKMQRQEFNLLDPKSKATITMLVVSILQQKHKDNHRIITP